MASVLGCPSVRSRLPRNPCLPEALRERVAGEAFPPERERCPRGPRWWWPRSPASRPAWLGTCVAHAHAPARGPHARACPVPTRLPTAPPLREFGSAACPGVGIGVNQQGALL